MSLAVFLFSIDFFYIYIYSRKFNAEFNELIQTVGHRARFIENWCWTHPPLPTILSLFGYFHILTYQVAKLKQNTENPKFCALIGCHCTKCSHKMCKTNWWKKYHHNHHGNKS